MDEVERHVPRPPSNTLIPITYNNATRDVARSSVPDSGPDLTYRLIRHALYTGFLALRLFIITFRLCCRYFTLFLRRISRESCTTRSILKRWKRWKSSWLHWPALKDILSAWSQVMALSQRLDRVTTLLEENIELLSTKHTDEGREKPSKLPTPVCLPDSESAISPATASEIYHAALADNRTLDNLLDTFDGGMASTISCTSIDELVTAPFRHATPRWKGTTPVQRSGEVLQILEPSQPDGTSETLSDKSQKQEIIQSSCVTSGPFPAALAPLMRYRSPAPSVSTQSSDESATSDRSITSNDVGNAAVLSAQSQVEAAAVPQARCTACDRSHSDTEDNTYSMTKSIVIRGALPYRPVPKSRQSAIPRRTGQSPVSQRVKIPPHRS